MWRATPEFVRALRQRYEDTDQLISSIATEFAPALVRICRRAYLTYAH